MQENLKEMNRRILDHKDNEFYDFSKDFLYFLKQHKTRLLPIILMGKLNVFAFEKGQEKSDEVCEHYNDHQKISAITEKQESTSFLGDTPLDFLDSKNMRKELSQDNNRQDTATKTLLEKLSIEEEEERTLVNSSHSLPDPFKSLPEDLQELPFDLKQKAYDILMRELTEEEKTLCQFMQVDSLLALYSLSEEEYKKARKSVINNKDVYMKFIKLKNSTKTTIDKIKEIPLQQKQLQNYQEDMKELNRLFKTLKIKKIQPVSQPVTYSYKDPQTQENQQIVMEEMKTHIIYEECLELDQLLAKAPKVQFFIAPAERKKK